MRDFITVLFWTACAVAGFVLGSMLADGPSLIDYIFDAAQNPGSLPHVGSVPLRGIGGE